MTETCPKCGGALVLGHTITIEGHGGRPRVCCLCAGEIAVMLGLTPAEVKREWNYPGGPNPYPPADGPL